MLPAWETLLWCYLPKLGRIRHSDPQQLFLHTTAGLHGIPGWDAPNGDQTLGTVYFLTPCCCSGCFLQLPGRCRFIQDAWNAVSIPKYCQSDCWGSSILQPCSGSDPCWVLHPKFLHLQQPQSCCFPRTVNSPR